MNKAYLESIKSSKTGIKCATHEEKLTLVGILISLNEKVGTETQKGDIEYPIVYFNGEVFAGMMEWGFSKKGNPVINFTEFITNLFNPNKKMLEYKLNKDYTAIYNKGDSEITVGCQKIPVFTLLNLIMEINKINT
jgi:hypothetical protein